MSKPPPASTGNHPGNHHHETQVTIVTTQKRTLSPFSQDHSQSDNVPKSQRQPHFSNGSQQSQMLLANQLKRMEKPMDRTDRPLSPMSQLSRLGLFWSEPREPDQQKCLQCPNRPPPPGPTSGNASPDNVPSVPKLEVKIILPGETDKGKRNHRMLSRKALQSPLLACYNRFLTTQTE